MFPTNKAKQYPYLAEFLNYVARQHPPIQAPSGLSVLAMGIGAICFTLGAWGVPGQVLLMLFGALAVGAGLFMQHRKPPELTPEHRRKLAAREVGIRMRQMIDQRRLHRDIDEGSLVLLEESARCWNRAHAALGSAYWTSDNLPVTYVAARRQALAAVDDAMDDILLLYQNHVPDQVTSRPAVDYVEEALETFVFKGKTSHRMPPPAFDAAREIAEKLRMLAEEAERLGQQGARQAGLPDVQIPGRSLDVALSELRTIRQAEEELRQDLRS